MPDIRKQFVAAAEAAKNLPGPPGEDDMLELYALYQQATVGDVRGERPDFFDVAAGAKYDAWAKLAGTSSVVAMQKYIDKVRALKR